MPKPRTLTPSPPPAPHVSDSMAQRRNSSSSDDPAVEIAPLSMSTADEFNLVHPIEDRTAPGIVYLTPESVTVPSVMSFEFELPRRLGRRSRYSTEQLWSMVEPQLTRLCSDSIARRAERKFSSATEHIDLVALLSLLSTMNECVRLCSHRPVVPQVAEIRDNFVTSDTQPIELHPLLLSSLKHYRTRYGISELAQVHFAEFLISVLHFCQYLDRFSVSSESLPSTVIVGIALCRMFIEVCQKIYSKNHPATLISAWDFVSGPFWPSKL